jgi:hypothetical protein
MLVVAIAACSVWGFKMSRLSRAYAARAGSHRVFESLSRRFAADSVRIAEVCERSAGYIPSDVLDLPLPKYLKDNLGNASVWNKHQAAQSRNDAALDKSKALVSGV